MLVVWLAAPAAALCQGNAAASPGQDEAAGSGALGLELRPVTDDSDGRADDQTGRYKVRGAVKIEVLMTNKSAGPLTVLALDTYYDNRPRLSRGGEIIPYRKNVSKLLQAKVKSPEFSRRDFIHLEPGQTKLVETINLETWYDPLEPGLYQLTIRRRFGEDWGWTPDSPAVTFEVIAGS